VIILLFGFELVGFLDCYCHWTMMSL